MPKPSAQRVLRMLEAAIPHGVPATALADIPCLDYRKRISELREEGHVIFTEDIPGKPYKAYRLAKEVA